MMGTKPNTHHNAEAGLNRGRWHAAYHYAADGVVVDAIYGEFPTDYIDWATARLDNCGMRYRREGSTLHIDSDCLDSFIRKFSHNVPIFAPSEERIDALIKSAKEAGRDDWEETERPVPSHHIADASTNTPLTPPRKSSPEKR